MERNTRSVNPYTDKQKPFAMVVLRFSLPALLVSGVILVTMPGSMRSEAQSQLAIRSHHSTLGPNPRRRKSRPGWRGLNDIAVVNRPGTFAVVFNMERVVSAASLKGCGPKPQHRDVDIGDLKGDGRNDIVVRSQLKRSLSVLLNQGNRRLAPRSTTTRAFLKRGRDRRSRSDGDNDLADISQCNRSSVLLNKARRLRS